MTIVSFIDDLKDLDVAFRLIVQILLTYICLPLFTNHFTGFHLENYKISPYEALYSGQIVEKTYSLT